MTLKQIDPITGICFFKVTDSMPLSEFLLSRDYAPLTQPHPAIAEWLEFGCIYVDGIRKRTDVTLKPEQLIRLHTRHKRYLYTPGELKERCVYQDDDLVVLDKPAGLPTHPTLDNFLENAKVGLETELGIALFTTHRLDIPTQGLLILAKSAVTQTAINKLFTTRRVKKVYRSINENAVAPGMYTHYMDSESHVPKKVQKEIHSNWWECRLQVESSKKGDAGWLHQLSLLTGRTHQIRAQLSALGAPIVGDEMYGAKTKFVPDGIALECYQLSFTLSSKTIKVVRPKSIFT